MLTVAMCSWSWTELTQRTSVIVKRVGVFLRQPKFGSFRNPFGARECEIRVIDFTDAMPTSIYEVLAGRTLLPAIQMLHSISSSIPLAEADRNRGPSPSTIQMHSIGDKACSIIATATLHLFKSSQGQQDV